MAKELTRLGEGYIREIDQTLALAPRLCYQEGFPLHTFEALGSLDTEGRDFLLSSFSSPLFTEIINRVIYWSKLGVNIGSVNFKQDYIGALFEVVAQEYTRRRILNRKELLFPLTDPGVFIAYAQTFSDRQVLVCRYKFNSGIDGVFLPDAIVMRQKKGGLYISGFCEYSTDQDTLVEKARRYRGKTRSNGFRLYSYIERREDLKMNLSRFLRTNHPDLPSRVLFDSQINFIPVTFPLVDDQDFPLLTNEEYRRVAYSILKDLKS